MHMIIHVVSGQMLLLLLLLKLLQITPCHRAPRTVYTEDVPCQKARTAQDPSIEGK